MGWIDVYRWRQLDALVVDCQADLLSGLPTRFVLPLLPESAGYAILRLNPIIMFGGKRVAVVPQLAMTLTIVELGQPIGSIITEEYSVMRALDVLMGGV